MARTRLAAAVMVAVAALATGCGSSGPDSRARTTGPPPEQEPRSRWGAPAGPYLGQPPRAIVMLLPGGAWTGIREARFEATLATASIYRRLGYATLTVEYRGGERGIDDVQRFYRNAAGRAGPRTPICAVGSSAGGHVALMVAVREAGLDCVVDLAGPTDLTTLVPDAEPTHRAAVRAFGADTLAAVSPVRRTSSIRARLMIVCAVSDPLVPVEQCRRMAKRVPGTELVVLPPGDLRWVHSTVDPSAKLAADRALFAFLAAAGK